MIAQVIILNDPPPAGLLIDGSQPFFDASIDASAVNPSIDALLTARHNGAPDGLAEMDHEGGLLASRQLRGGAGGRGGPAVSSSALRLESAAQIIDRSSRARTVRVALRAGMDKS